MKSKKIIINKIMQGENFNFFEESKSDDSQLRASLGSLQGQSAQASDVIPAESSNAPYFSPQDQFLINLAEEKEEEEKAEEKKEDEKREKRSKNFLNSLKEGEEKPIKLLKRYKKFKKNKAWQFTLNEIERWDDLKKKFLELKQLTYGVAAKETAPKTGHKHIHAYIQLKGSWAPNQEIQDLGAHIELCKGSPEQNDKYIRKDGDIIWEYGQLRGKKNENSFPSIKDVEGMSQLERRDLPLQYYNVIEKINQKEMEPHNVFKLGKKVKCYYIWGPSGFGKSLYAKIAIAKLNQPFDMVKYESTFWSGVGHSPIALYDDWRDGDMQPRELINFVDYNIHNMNIKGGGVPNNYKYIFITTVLDPDEIYQQAQKWSRELKQQWLRRVQIVHLPEIKTHEEIVGEYEKIFGPLNPPENEDNFDINNLF